MNISPLYELLIFIEDRGSVSISDIQKWGKELSRGILGKMEAMKLIDKKETPEKQYSLSDSGHKFLNSVLDTIHRPVLHWDSKWRFVWFSIPEKTRSKRDKFRRFLEGIGMKPILNSLWVGAIDQKQIILNEISRLNIQDRILFVETENPSGISKKDILNGWDFETSRSHYEEFIVKCNEYFPDSYKDSYKTKKLIFEYALILNTEPNLPIELLPDNWPKFRAQLQYKKIKRLLVK
ncbi:MAG: hypothetical protein NTZ65_01690 [Candidatus Berkelbacteria bacterium]|nr:hypothetical protein [Candidatus Berkelbacteria bacterium]